MDGSDAHHTHGEPAALISRSALLHNVGIIRRSLAPGTKLCAIVKADAYGHGAALVADTLLNFATADGREGPVVDALAVADMDEAAGLPATHLPIIILRPIETGFIGRQKLKIETAIRYGWKLTLCSAAAVDDVARIALGVGRRASVQLMIDTGMARSGLSMEQTTEVLGRIEARPSLRLAGIFTHFANSEVVDDAYSREQLSRFRSVTDDFVARREMPVIRHAANSGGVFLMPASHFDMVRPGISLYGIDPTGRPSMDRPLKPILKWTAPLVGIKDVIRGATVGYNQTWKADRETRIGLIPVGYADGYPRSMGNRAVVMIHGKPCPVVGRVSMDLITVDLRDHPNACLGDVVTLMDNDPLSPCSIYRLAEWDNTIPYELLCRIGKRVPRVAVAPADAPLVAEV